MNFRPLRILIIFLITITTTGQDIGMDWIHRDISSDSLPGSSLVKAYKELQKLPLPNKTIIAVIDMPINTSSKYLKEKIWINKDEVPNNGIDDDANGYVDDIQGWNFLGTKKGKTLLYSRYDYTRILSAYDSNDHVKIDATLVSKAKEAYEVRTQYADKSLSYAVMVDTNATNALTYIDSIFQSRSYDLNSLDSLKLMHPKDSVLQLEALKRTNFIKLGYTSEVNKERLEHAQNRIRKLLNKSYNDRILIGDSLEHQYSFLHGHHKVNADYEFLDHGTKVAGMLTTAYLYPKDTIDLLAPLQIMPLVVASYGDEHDKDIAAAIRYAVDNGAKVINLSFGKILSFREEWVDDALKYAERNDVLVVQSAGNSNLNLDVDFSNFPNDNQNGKEIFDNYLIVGGISPNLNKKLTSDYTNYGLEQVDIFAPSQEIASLNADDTIELDMSGTSYAAPIVSAVAGLLFSYFPNLNAKEIKQIIMASSSKIDFEVVLPGTKDKETLVSFKQLSKSGGILNAYKAVLLARHSN